jgi:hypothetical protein
VPALGHEPHVLAILNDHQPKAVVLDLVKPRVGGRDFRTFLWQGKLEGYHGPNLGIRLSCRNNLEIIAHPAHWSVIRACRATIS